MKGSRGFQLLNDPETTLQAPKGDVILALVGRFDASSERRNASYMSEGIRAATVPGRTPEREGAPEIKSRVNQRWEYFSGAFRIVRLQNKVAIVVGAGQTPGDTIGNGRATAILFAREGARVVLVDRDLESARETRAMIEAEGGECLVCEADVTRRSFSGPTRRSSSPVPCCRWTADRARGSVAETGF
jgi:hypothetical protein